MEVAVFGGSFNPPHVGHALVTAWVLWTGQADAVWLVPCADHPLGKLGLAPFSARVRWCGELASGVGSAARVETIEDELPRPSFTIDTLRALSAAHPEHAFRLVVGADILQETHLWKDWAIDDSETSIDVRYAADDIVSHSEYRFPCIPVDAAAEILRLVGDAQVVGIDEAQFFDGTLVEVANRLADEGRRVVIAGLDQDYRGIPFEPIPALLAVAEYVTKSLAVCMVCGSPANRSQRLVQRDLRVLLGSSETYEARCRLHWDPEVFDPEQQSLPLSGA